MIIHITKDHTFMKYLGQFALCVLVIALAACGATSQEVLPTVAVIEQSEETTEANGELAPTAENSESETNDEEDAAPSDSLELPRGDVTVVVPNPGGRWDTFVVETPGLGTTVSIVSSDITLLYSLDVGVTDKLGETLERNLRMILGEEPEVLEENGVRYVEGDDFTLYVDVNDTFYATVGLTRGGGDEIEPPYSEDWREMALNLEIIE